MIVEAQNLCHYYRRSSGNIAVLDNVDFTLDQGEFVAIMGGVGVREVHFFTHTGVSTETGERKLSFKR